MINYYRSSVRTPPKRAEAEVNFSVTIRADRAVRAAIASIPQTAWTAIRYPRAVWDEDGQCWISEAEVAETSYTLGAHTAGR